MTDRELKKLKRNELLEMLIAQIDENERLKHRMEEQKRQLQDRQIAVEQAGSIAEAALKLNGVFEAAQSAAQQYLENVQRLSTEQDSICRRKMVDAEKKAAEILAEADAYKNKSRLEAEAYWNQIDEKIQNLICQQESLHGLLQLRERGDQK